MTRNAPGTGGGVGDGGLNGIIGDNDVDSSITPLKSQDHLANSPVTNQKLDLIHAGAKATAGPIIDNGVETNASSPGRVDLPESKSVIDKPFSVSIAVQDGCKQLRDDDCERIVAEIVYGGSHWATLSVALQERLGAPKVTPFLR
jgi:hypothetical protein